jgi:hypothetical protein
MSALILTQEHLQKIFYYNTETGIFTRLVSTSLGSHPGDLAGCLTRDGYWIIKIGGKIYPAHRLAWFYVNGKWPTKHLDHINGIKNDNRFCNLREVSVSENQQNLTKAHKDSKSGFLGVIKKGKVFKARIKIDGKQKHLGTFATPELAFAAYVKAKREFHPMGML